jgi:uncharacterized membrane protein
MGDYVVLYLLLLLIGVTAGLRAATPLAALAIGAWLGWIDLTGTWAGFAGNIVTVVVLVIIAILELIGDQLPQTPSRKSPPAFTGRVIAGALAGTVLGLATGAWIVGLILGVVGAVAGTFGGYEVRRLLARAFGRDLPAALIEDVVAIVVALLVVWAA